MTVSYDLRKGATHSRKAGVNKFGIKMENFCSPAEYKKHMLQLHNKRKCGNYKRRHSKKIYENKINKPGYLETVSAYASNRRAVKKQATPPWSQLGQIMEFFKKRPKGYPVDHVIPLQTDIVCGLHVLANLQYLLATKNIKKGNNFNG